MKKFYAFAIIVLVTSLTFSNKSFAQTTWTGFISNNWGTAANWSTFAVPAAGTDVIIPNGSTVNVNVAATCGSLTISGGTNNTTVTVNTGQSLTVTTSSGKTGLISMGAAANNNTVLAITLNASTSVLNAADITMADVTTGNGNTSERLNVNNGTANISGNATMNGSAASENRIVISSGTFKIGGTLSPVNGTFTIGTGTVEYNGAGAQTMRVATYNNLTLSGSGSKTGAVTVNTTLSIQGSATLGTAVTYSTATLEYKGTGAQTTTDFEFPTTMPANVVIDNTSGVILNNAKTLNGNLTLTNGYLTTSSTNLLTLSTTSTATTSNGAFVDGPLKKNTASTAAFTFPIGKAGRGLRTAGIVPATSAASAYTAEYFAANPKTAVSGNLGTIDQISNCEYWDVAKVSGANASIVLSFLAAGSNCGSTTWGYIGNTATLLVAHYNGTNWVNAGNASISGTPGTGGTITSNSQSTFSPFTLATSNGLLNPLPVKFANVKAYQRNAGVQVEWTNLTEKDVLRYTVERSSNGISYSPVAEINARGNQNNVEQYASFDASPVSGANFYRVTAMEITGKTIYSNVMKVDMGQQDKALSLYPNPVKNHQLNYTFSSQRGLYTVSVFNSNGQVVLSKQLQHDGGAITQMIELPASVKTGVYSLKVIGDGFSMVKPFIVQ